MAYTVICRDISAEKSTALRAAELRAHLDYVDSIQERLLVAGPLKFNNSNHFNGSLFIYDVSTEAEACRLLESDPYFIAGLYGDISYAPFMPARGLWL